jgi:exodeoxyribonuclease V alpha subunit
MFADMRTTQVIARQNDTHLAAHEDQGKQWVKPSTRDEWLILIENWVACGWIRPLDAGFARFLWNEVSEAPPLLILGALLASHQLGQGHVCLDLAATLADPQMTLALPPAGEDCLATDGSAGYPPAEILVNVAMAGWLEALQHPILVSAGPGNTPLVLVGQRLYLRRCWQYEQAVNAGIAHRLAGSAGSQEPLSVPRLRVLLDALFVPPPSVSAAEVPVDWQKLACAVAARSAVTIITGGPGTGKTTTVVKVLAVLQALALEATAAQPLCIKLAAPTGKAAARLSTSIASAVARLPLMTAQAEAIRQAIPTQVVTLHRLLGNRPGSRKFRHHANSLLNLDVLVVDEASMIDLETMAALLQALPSQARLILLGDKDQLASVEAGAVLASLCQDASVGRYTPATREWLQQATGIWLDDRWIDPQGTPLHQSVVMLRASHRFAGDSGIGRLATAVNLGDPNMAKPPPCGQSLHTNVTYLMGQDSRPRLGDLVVQGWRDASLPAARQAPQGYAHYLHILQTTMPVVPSPPAAWDDWARRVLHAHSAFQLLTIMRQGEWGVEGLNRRVAHRLHNAGLIAATEGWYVGRPVLVMRNDYALGLMNGDIGITLPLLQTGQRAPVLRVAFLMTEGSRCIKWVSPSRLQAVETVFALTVHKSQGSEFDHVALVLPEHAGPLLTRELLYTGITRARTFITLVSPGGEAVLEQGIARQVRRASGLGV